MALAILMAAVPMPEPPACTSTLSPGSSRALSNSMCCTVPKAIGAQAASSKETPSGTLTTSRCGMLTKSQAKPSMWKPMMPPTFSHRLSRPSTQARQVPQVRAPYMTTLSPTSPCVTSSPMSTTAPAASAPTTSGILRLAKAMPRKPHTSMWLSPTAWTRICTSPGPGCGGLSTSSSLRSRSPWSLNARMSLAVSSKFCLGRAASAVHADLRGEPAVDRQDRARDIARRLREKKGDEAGDLLRPGEAAGRDLLFHIGAIGGVGRHHVRVDEARRHVVDGDAALGRLHGERADVAEERALGRRIGGIARVALQRRHRADDDDAPGP